MAAGAAIILAGVTAKPAVPGAEVGFWALQDRAVFTAEVWDALESSHGVLYLRMDYRTDFGPPLPGKKLSPLGLKLIREANRRGVKVKAWLIAPASKGTFANENNADLFAAAVRDFDAYVTQHGVDIAELVLDLEFPAGYQPLADALAGDPSGLRANINPRHQCEAIATYNDTIAWAHAHGWRMTGAPVLFAFDDLMDGHIALQDALDITAFGPTGYDTYYLQVYRTYSNAGTGLVPGYYRDLQGFFGARGQITLGDTVMRTPPYNDLDKLVKDVRILAGLGATAIPIYELGGTVNAFGAAGVKKVIEAGRRPLSGDRLARAARPDAYSGLHRTVFQGLDTVASALTTVVTAGGKPNAYPNPCGF